VRLLRHPFILMLVLAAQCLCASAQIPAIPNAPSQSQPATTPPKDPRGRETPQGVLLNFTKYAQRGDFETAAKYLDPPTAKHRYDAEEVARQLIVLINTSFRGSIASVSNRPEGSVADSDDPNTETVGNLVVDDESVPILLTRVVRQDVGPIWLVSSQTLALVPRLYQRAGSPRLAEYFPDFLIRNKFLDIPLGQWVSWILSIPISLLAAWALFAVGAWLWTFRRHPIINQPRTRYLGKPIVYVIAILIHARLVLLVGMPIFYRVYYFRVLMILSTISTAWLFVRIGNQLFEHARQRKMRRESQSLLQLVHRFSNVIILVVGLLLILSILGFDTKTMLAGLGIGGIALALAAQKTLENLIGGITLVMDETASVGDDCVISGRQVTVQEIGLRSIHVTTREGTEIAYPNGMLSQASIENLSRRTRFLIWTQLYLSYDCSLAQLQLAIVRVREILYSHARVETESARFRLSGFSPTGFSVELFVYVLTSSGAEFTAIQEDILFRVAEVVESAGARWAPSQVTNASKDQPVDSSKLADAEQMVHNWQTSKNIPFPDFSPVHIAEVRGTLPYPPEGSAVNQNATRPRESKEVA